MRVLLSCLQSQRRHLLPAYEFWRPYFVEGCREADIECVEVPGVDWAEGLTYPPGDRLREWRAAIWESVLSFVRRENRSRPVDFFLGYLYPSQVEPAAIAELQRLGVPCVNFFCDNVREFRRVPDEYRPFALHWVPEMEALTMYARAGLPHLHAPMPCWVPPKFRTVPEIETEPPTFIGSADIMRRHLLGRALRAGAQFVVRGPGWDDAPRPDGTAVAPGGRPGILLASQWGVVRAHGVSALLRKVANRLHPLDAPALKASQIRPVVSNEEYLTVTRNAMITLGVNRVATARASNHHPLTYSRLRDIEAPMLGACYLTEWTAGLEALYELGTEIETYKTSEELVAKMDALSKDPIRRRKLRQRGQRRALGDHSAAKSLTRIARRVSA